MDLNLQSSGIDIMHQYVHVSVMTIAAFRLMLTSDIKLDIDWLVVACQQLRFIINHSCNIATHVRCTCSISLTQKVKGLQRFQANQPSYSPDEAIVKLAEAFALSQLPSFCFQDISGNGQDDRDASIFTSHSDRAVVASQLLTGSSSTKQCGARSSRAATDVISDIAQAAWRAALAAARKHPEQNYGICADPIFLLSLIGFSHAHLWQSNDRTVPSSSQVVPPSTLSELLISTLDMMTDVWPFARSTVNLLKTNLLLSACITMPPKSPHLTNPFFDLALARSMRLSIFPHSFPSSSRFQLEQPHVFGEAKDVNDGKLTASSSLRCTVERLRPQLFKSTNVETYAIPIEHVGANTIRSSTHSTQTRVVSSLPQQQFPPVSHASSRLSSHSDSLVFDQSMPYNCNMTQNAAHSSSVLLSDNQPGDPLFTFDHCFPFPSPLSVSSSSVFPTAPTYPFFSPPLPSVVTSPSFGSAAHGALQLE